MSTPIPTLEAFLDDARSWLDDHAERAVERRSAEVRVGTGRVQRRRCSTPSTPTTSGPCSSGPSAGPRPRPSAATTPSPRRSPYGGLGYPRAYALAFARLEREYVRPAGHETHSVTTRLIAPTIMACGSDGAAGQAFVPRFLAARELCCQLFSEPGAGSDLAALGCRAVRDGDEWVINGQKVWSSGALFSEWGELIARSDPDVPKHKGMTAFIVPMDLPGIEVRPIKQMSGGSSFNEVFFTDVRVPDSMRLGDEGDGWRVALTTLGFERDHSESAGQAGSVAGGSRSSPPPARWA